jgi:hypothetical protein
MLSKDSRRRLAELSRPGESLDATLRRLLGWPATERKITRQRIDPAVGETVIIPWVIDPRTQAPVIGGQKSIRHLIYRLRKRGYKIIDTPLPSGTRIHRVA